MTAPSGQEIKSAARMAGLETPGLRASGQVRLGGHIVSDLPAERRQLGLLFQTPLLFPHLTVADNLGLDWLLYHWYSPHKRY